MSDNIVSLGMYVIHFGPLSISPFLLSQLHSYKSVQQRLGPVPLECVRNCSSLPHSMIQTTGSTGVAGIQKYLVVCP